MKRSVCVLFVGMFVASLDANAQVSEPPAPRSSLVLPEGICEKQEFATSCAYIKCASSDCQLSLDDFDAKGRIDANQALAGDVNRTPDDRFWAYIILTNLFRISDRPLEAWLQLRKAAKLHGSIQAARGADPFGRQGPIDLLAYRMRLGKGRVHVLAAPGRSLSNLALNGVAASDEDWGDLSNSSDQRQGPKLYVPPGRLTIDWKDGDRECRQDFIVEPATSSHQELDLSCPRVESPACPTGDTSLEPCIPEADAATWPLWTAFGVTTAATITFGVLWANQASEADQLSDRYLSTMQLADRSKSEDAHTARNRWGVVTALSGGAAVVLTAWLLDATLRRPSSASDQVGRRAPLRKTAAMTTSLSPRLDGSRGLDLTILF